jgi:hypothetical protein
MTEHSIFRLYLKQFQMLNYFYKQIRGEFFFSNLTPKCHRGEGGVSENNEIWLHLVIIIIPAMEFENLILVDQFF